MNPASSPNLKSGYAYKLVPNGGVPEPRGATLMEEGCNFSVYSERATAIWVCFFDEMDAEIARIQLDGHEDNVFYGLIAGVASGARYGLRADGPFNPDQGLHFDPQKLLVDPYAKRLDRVYVRSPRLRLSREYAEDTAPLVPKAIIGSPASKLVTPRQVRPNFIYELNVRGYTMRNKGVQGPLRGTVAGLTTQRVIDHLKHIGVDTVELLPVAAWMDDGHLPKLGLTNAWGYNPISYFAPDPRIMPRGIGELRNLADTYRRNGISILLDVVYNHTGEGDANGPAVSLMGLDALTYYRHVDVDGVKRLVNDTGTGNTLQCDHPEVRRLVIDSLKYWVQEGGVSGFRFDLAPILGRRASGFDPHAELLEEMKADKILSKSILVAEPWDPGPGGYQLGAFGKGFYEWNDKYRDDVRGFWRGDENKLGALAARLTGSAEVFGGSGRKPSAGVNFLAVHDGFTLADLVSYAEKHNEANGEENRDGHSHNLSWNCGVEGPTDDPDILFKRKRDLRALIATLFVSRGTLMMQQGDEMGRTQMGNNNAYAQDNEITWVDWESADGELIDFVCRWRQLRKAHPALTVDRFLTGKQRHGHRDVIWRSVSGNEMCDAEWNDATGSVLGMQLSGVREELLVWINRWVEPVPVTLPDVQEGHHWKVELGSAFDTPGVDEDGTLELPARSVTVLIAVHEAPSSSQSTE